MEAAVELPQYRSHKVVRAARITGFRQNGNPDMPDLLLGEIGGVVALLPDWHAKHKPTVGGYYVLYEDGYASFSPAKAFELGYTRVFDNAPLVGEQTVEGEILVKGKTAPRVTPDDIEDNIVSEFYFTAADGLTGAKFNAKFRQTIINTAPGPLHLLTFCVLVLRNGFTVTGESACASPENFDEAIGQRIARENAKQKIWPLMGYQLKERLYQSQQPPVAPV